MKQWWRCLALGLALTPGLALGEEASYSYLEAGALHHDVDHLGSGNGVALAGSLAFGEHWHGFVSYQDSDRDYVDIRYNRAGIGYRLPLDSGWDLIARLSYESSDYDPLGDGDGYGVEVAVRGALGTIDLEAGVRMRDLDVNSNIVCIAIHPTPPPCAFMNDQQGTDTRGFVNLGWRFNSNWSLVLSGEAGGKGNQVFIGPRWSF